MSEMSNDMSLSGESDMTDESLKCATPVDACQELAKLVDGYTDGRGNGIHSTALAQLEFMRESTAPTTLCSVYEPTLCIIL